MLKNGWIVLLSEFMGSNSSRSQLFPSLEPFRIPSNTPWHYQTQVSNILNQNAIKKRLRTNAINLVGQVFTWFVECLPMAVGILVLIVDRQEKGREILALLKIFRFLLIPAVEVATSPPMKRFLADHFNWCIRTPRAPTTSSKNNSSQTIVTEDCKETKNFRQI